MSVVCVLAPVVVASWPVLTSAVVSAMAALGYTKLEGKKRKLLAVAKEENSVELELPNSKAVTDDLGAGDEMLFQKGDIRVTFYKTIRGKCGIRVEGGKNIDCEELQSIGKEIGEKVVQRYIYQRIREELENRHFIILEEEQTQDEAIRIRVRQWTGN